MSRSSGRLPRGSTACQRCRRRKQKCDLKSPSCSNCDDANAPCLVYHTGKQTELTFPTIPRNYVSTLEAQVAQLTRENAKLRERTITPTNEGIPTTSSCNQNGTTGNTPTNEQDWMSSSLGRVVCEPLSQPQFYGVSSGITLARLVMAAIHIDKLPPPLTGEHRPRQINSDMFGRAANASLPPRRVADHLVEVYFQYRTPHFPIIERSRVDQALEGVYGSIGSHEPLTPEESQNIFATYMVFAIALCGIHHPSGGRPPESEDCFHSAVGQLNLALQYATSRLESLRALLLLCQYITLCPSKGSLWLLTGTALRLAVDSGLHWETEENKLQMQSDRLNDRRRLWYSAYMFDRLLCVTLGRPFGFADQGLGVALPDSHKVESDNALDRFSNQAGQAHNSLITLAQLESEIKHVLYSHFRGSTLAFPRANYPVWIQDIQFRLQSWYDAIPLAKDAHPSSIFAIQAYWDAVYNNALLLLHRPNPVAPQPSVDSLRISYEASCKVIASIKDLHRAHKIDILWKWVHHLFMAGLTVLYALWHSSEMREEIEARRSISALQSCSSTLSAFSERWDGAEGCRNAFESLSSATIDWLVTSNAEVTRQSESQFEKQLQDLEQQLPPGFATESIVSGSLGILSSGSFGFGETLSSAAEWPSMTQPELGDPSYGATDRLDASDYRGWGHPFLFTHYDDGNIENGH